MMSFHQQVSIDLLRYSPALGLPVAHNRAQVWLNAGDLTKERGNPSADVRSFFAS